MKKYYSSGIHKCTKFMCLQFGGRVDFTQVSLSFESDIYFGKPLDIHVSLHLLFFKVVFSLALGKDEDTKDL